MKKNLFSVAALFLAAALLSSSPSFAQDLKPVLLPKPQTEGGRPLMQVLKERKTVREFSPKALPVQTLANLLWAAWGINRPESGRRTAPSAMNRQEIDLYVATSEGLYLYDAKENLLKTILTRDVRVLTGRQAFVKEAPVRDRQLINFTF
jgi:hypothetical protein